MLAGLARGRLKAKRGELEQALVGTLKPHHRFLLTEHLVLIDTLEEAIRRVSQEIEIRMEGPDPAAEQPLPAPEPSGDEAGQPQHERLPLPWKQAAVIVDAIPGIHLRAAQGILAEVGTDMRRFKSDRHLCSWAGICLGNYESAGKRLSGRTRKGNPYLRKLLVEAAQAAAHTKGTYPAAQYRRLAARRGARRAMVAVAHTILTIIYHLLAEHRAYEELGGTYFDERDRQATERRLVHRLEKLGYQVSLQPIAQVV